MIWEKAKSLYDILKQKKDKTGRVDGRGSEDSKYWLSKEGEEKWDYDNLKIDMMSGAVLFFFKRWKILNVFTY